MSSPDHVYLDLSVINNDITGTQVSQNLYFSENRNSTIIDNPKDYYLSVIRFTLDTPARTLPILIPHINNSAEGPNQTIYYVTIANSTTKVLSTVPVMWIPQDKSASIPNVNNDPYYYCWSAKWFMQLVNTALATAALEAGLVSDTVPSPFLTFDEASSTFSLLVPRPFTYGIETANPFATIYFNAPLFNLFSSFNSSYFGTSPTDIYGISLSTYISNSLIYPNILATNPGVCAYQILFQNEEQINKIVIGSNTFYEFQQEYPSLALWSPISSIVFTSTQLPIVMNQTSPPAVYNSDTTQTTGNNAQIIPLISDFVVPLSSGFEYKPNLEYAPSAEYRLIDLQGNNPVTNVNFAVYWKDKYGNITPFKLGAQCSSTIKLLFRKKDVKTKGYNV